MLKPFLGEFLISPFPLELSYGLCDYGCTYCYQYLRRRHYESHWKFNSILRLITEPQRYTHTNAAATLLELGYPILISNHTEPFCPSNIEYTTVIVQACVDSGRPVAFQTKTGPGLLELAQTLPPSVFAVTVTTVNDELSAVIEPGAPRSSERLRAIEQLARMGHGVVVYCIPFMPEAVGDMEQYVRTIASAGASALHVEPIMLRRVQVETIRREGIILPYPVSLYVRSRYIPNPHILLDEAEKAGLVCYTSFPNRPMRYRAWLSRYYDKLFPTLSDFVNRCFDEADSLGAGTDEIMAVYYDDFVEYIVPMLPDMRVRVDDYVRVIFSDASELRSMSYPTYGTLRDVLPAVWDGIRPRYRIDLCTCFAMACAEVHGELARVVDESGHTVYLFSRIPFESPLQVVTLERIV